MSPSPYLEHRRVYLPLKHHDQRPLLTFANNAQIVRLPELERPNLQTWGSVLSREDINRFHRTEFWLIYDYECASGARVPDPEEQLSNTLIALQVLSPTGCDHFVMFTKTLGSEYSNLTLHTRNRLNSCGWARLVGWQGVTPDHACRVVDGVLQSIQERQIRFINPIRLLEHGLYSTEPYMQALLWVMGLDGLLMAGNDKVFASRLCRLLGGTTQVFPRLQDAYIICRTYTVEELATEMYQLRNAIAHGREIPQKFWVKLPEISVPVHHLPYEGMATLGMVVAEGSLMLLCNALQTILLGGMMPVFSSTKKWREYLDS